jgi:hypothetical protein
MEEYEQDLEATDKLEIHNVHNSHGWSKRSQHSSAHSREKLSHSRPDDGEGQIDGRTSDTKRR